MAKYTHLFFDLDRTLWDMERNAHETLSELFHRYGLAVRGVPSADVFVSHYNEYNNLLWDRYRRKLIDKSTLRALRFKQALAHFGIHDKKLAEQFDHDYITEAPRKTNLIPGAKELLDQLHGKYELHIITNGFPEVQEFKMRNSGLDRYFGEVITSEGVGHAKPDKRIFQYASRVTKSTKEVSLMIGDDLHADIVGARDAGWDQVYFNPENGKHSEEVAHEIAHLSEILKVIR
jgi:putative hydrolase of the HAD superfamily